MTQQAVPIADVSNNGWNPEPLYEHIQDYSWFAEDYVSSPADPNANTFIVQLSPLTWPINRLAGKLKIRIRKTNTDNLKTFVSLVQGNSLLNLWVIEPTETFDTYTLALSASELQAITNYSDLRVRVQAGGQGGIPVLCCPVPLPETVHATFTNVLFCSCLNGFTMALPYDYTEGKWKSNANYISPCSSQARMRLELQCVSGHPVCQGITWLMNLFCDDVLTSSVCYPLSVQCYPFSIRFSAPGEACCNAFTTSLFIDFTA